MVIVNTLRLDPTRTTLIRRQFISDMVRRFKALNRKIYTLIVTDDVFGLTTPDSPMRFNSVTNNQFQEWRFNNDAQKIFQYRKWLNEQVQSGILTTVGGISDRPWTAKYIESAYQRGQVNAYLQMRKKDIAEESSIFIGGKKEFLRSAFSQPMVQAKIEMLYTRAFDELKGVTDAMSQQMSRVLTSGFLKGDGPREIAKELSKIVTKITNTRAKVIARTEVIRSHAEGQLDSFESLGVKEVGLQAEWLTAGDDLVCPLCSPMEGEIYKKKDARNMIPLHPNCRCMWMPSDINS